MDSTLRNILDDLANTRVRLGEALDVIEQQREIIKHFEAGPTGTPDQPTAADKPA